MRQLATFRTIDDIQAIEGADLIEVATVGGWKSVVKKGQFAVGEEIIYCEVDSFIPNEIAPFLSKGEPSVYQGIKGERLRTVKLKGQVSQGLVLPISLISDGDYDRIGTGETLEDVLGIIKFEPPANAQLSGNQKGYFPGFIPKTDQERIQNLKKDLGVWVEDRDLWEVTEKLDGSSMTVYAHYGEVGVCSRNFELKLDDPNTFCTLAKSMNLLEKVASQNQSLAFQGEVIGPGIQGNKYKLDHHVFCVYDIFDISFQEYLEPDDRIDLCRDLGIPHVPVLDRDFHLLGNIESFLDFAEGKSKLNPSTEREGLVFKRDDGKQSFKAISNKFLLKGD